MVLPGHIAGGYLATSALLAVVSSIAPDTLVVFSNDQIVAFYILGMIAGELPDIDLIWFYLENRRQKVVAQDKTTSKDHRDFVTHLPLFWLCVSIVICLTGLAFNSAFIYFTSFVVLAGILSHFIFDSIEHGICWLWPFSKKRYCLLQARNQDVIDESPRGETSRDQIGGLTYYWRFIVSTYIKSPTFITEVVVTVVALVLLLRLHLSN